MTLEWFVGSYYAWRLPAGSLGPDDAFCLMRTPDETTVITLSESPPEGAEVSGPWRMFRISEQLPHDAVGILAKLSHHLAVAGIPILAYGSYDTDYVCVPGAQASAAVDALTQAGYRGLG